MIAFNVFDVLLARMLRVVTLWRLQHIIIPSERLPRVGIKSPCRLFRSALPKSRQGLLILTLVLEYSSFGVAFSIRFYVRAYTQA